MSTGQKTNRFRLTVILGAVLALGWLPTATGASHPAAQSSSSAARKKKAAAKSKKKPKVKGQTAPTADRIREIQTALQKDGSFEGEPNGKWDDATAEAMRKYQDKNGITPTGKIDAISLHKLGLGSETAGKGAPVPATSGTTSTPMSAPASAAADPQAK